MRKLNNPMPAGGAPFNNEDLNDVFQTEVWDAMQALVNMSNWTAGGSDALIISGCVVTANASNFDMTAGIVYISGEFMRIDAVTNQTFTKYIVASTPTNVARTFNDAASKTMIIEKKASLSGSSSGQFITISSLLSSLPLRVDQQITKRTVATTIVSGGGGTTVIFTTPALATGQSVMMEFDVMATVKSATPAVGHTSGSKLMVLAKNIAGTVTIGTVGTIFSSSSDAGAPTYSIAVSGLTVTLSALWNSGHTDHFMVKYKPTTI